MDIENHNIFKFFKVDQFLYSSLINNELFFADSRNFNDPFDSRPIFQFTKDLEQGKKLFNSIQNELNKSEDLIKKLHQYNSKREFHSEMLNNMFEAIIKTDALYEAFNRDKDERLIRMHIFYNEATAFEKAAKIDFVQLQKYMFQDFVFLLIDFKGVGITCGSLKADCPVMWGHYGSNHTGVCLEFETLDQSKNDILSYKDEVNFEVAPVLYSNEPINLYKEATVNLQEVQKQLLATKSAKWEYESEVRLSAPKQGPLKFKRSALKTIIFGAKSTPKDRYTICKLLASLGYKFEFKISRIQTDRYEMNIDIMILEDIAGSGVHIEELGLKKQFNEIMNN